MTRPPSSYQLLDCGDGRKLERFGPVVLDRPAPATDWFRPRRPSDWKGAAARFDRESGWTGDRPPAEPWVITAEELTLELRPAAGGQVGYFPEQADVRAWVSERVRAAAATETSDSPPRVLSLFAFTGAASLVAARAGAAVVHVDASRTAVAWARRNAELSGLTEQPIRWLAEDAFAWLRREARRGSRYDGIVLDPPTFGRGPRGETWRMDAGLAELLGAVRAVLTQSPGAFVALTAHTPDLGPDRLENELSTALGGGVIEAGALALHAESGATLEAGAYGCWSR